MIKKLSKISEIPLNSLSVLIIGSGKIGLGLAAILASDCKRIGLVDHNKTRLEYCVDYLNKGECQSILSTHHVQADKFYEYVPSLISEYDLVVCTTSNINYLITDSQQYKNCLIIDDSRPEAFIRYFSVEQNAAVLEGGIMKFDGLLMNSNFGFGRRRNIFGCLAEAVLLSYDKGHKLTPSIGDIDLNNIRQYISYISENSIGVDVGDWKCGNVTLRDDDLIKILRRKAELVAR